MVFMKKITALLLVLFLTLTMLASCGGADMNYGGEPGENSPSKGEMGTTGTTTGDGSYAPDAEEDYERKIIKTYHLSLEAKKYETARNDILSAANALGGYISDSSEKDSVTYDGKKNRHATFTVRVPSEKADEYVAAIAKNASVLSKKLSTEDITTSYYDLEAQLESLLEQQERIEKLMDETTNFTYLLQLEDKLTSIRTQINGISKQIQIYDKSVALSYVYITLDEVVEYTEIVEEDPTFGDRIAEAFVGTFQNFWNFCQELVIVAVWLLPGIIIVGVSVPVIVFFARRYDKKKRAKYEAEIKSREEKK